MKLLAPLPADRAEIETLLDVAFGADRHGRTAYRLRDGGQRLDQAGLIARDDAGGLAGSIEFWPIDIVEDGSGIITPAVLLGPIAVAPRQQGRGLGKLLIRSGLDSLAQLGIDTSVLIGDPGYYARFGFSSSQTGGWRLPGPFEPHRLLARTARPDEVLPAPALLRAARAPLPLRPVLAAPVAAPSAA